MCVCFGGQSNQLDAHLPTSDLTRFHAEIMRHMGKSSNSEIGFELRPLYLDKKRGALILLLLNLHFQTENGSKTSTPNILDTNERSE